MSEAAVRKLALLAAVVCVLLSPGALLAQNSTNEDRVTPDGPREGALRGDWHRRFPVRNYRCVVQLWGVRPAQPYRHSQGLDRSEIAVLLGRRRAPRIPDNYQLRVARSQERS